MNASAILGRLILATGLASGLCGPAQAQAQAQAPSGAVAPQAATAGAAMPLGASPSLRSPPTQGLGASTGYLPSGEIPDSFHILPPAPSGDSPARRTDIAAYRETRRLRGGARWSLAASDAVIGPAAMLDDESCALGAKLDSTNAPHLVELITRMGRDTSRIVNESKDQFKQVRPFVALGGPICTESDRAATARSYAYPSGHTTYSWSVGLILAEIAPDRATPILARARAYGESRVVCGVHWVSDVEEGRTNASILVAVLHSEPQFRADLAVAKQEVDAVRANGMSSAAASAGAPQCALEASQHTPWTR